MSSFEETSSDMDPDSPRRISPLTSVCNEDKKIILTLQRLRERINQSSHGEAHRLSIVYQEARWRVLLWTPDIEGAVRLDDLYSLLWRQHQTHVLEFETPGDDTPELSEPGSYECVIPSSHAEFRQPDRGGILSGLIVLAPFMDGSTHLVEFDGEDNPNVYWEGRTHDMFTRVHVYARTVTLREAAPPHTHDGELRATPQQLIRTRFLPWYAPSREERNQLWSDYECGPAFASSNPISEGTEAAVKMSPATRYTSFASLHARSVLGMSTVLLCLLAIYMAHKMP